MKHRNAQRVRFRTTFDEKSRPPAGRNEFRSDGAAKSGPGTSPCRSLPSHREVATISRMSTPRPNAREIVARGQAIYESKIRPLVENDHLGEYLVLDIETGEYEIDADHLAASNRAAAKRPHALLFAMRIGYRAGGRIGARARPVRT